MWEAPPLKYKVCKKSTILSAEAKSLIVNKSTILLKMSTISPLVKVLGCGFVMHIAFLQLHILWVKD